MAREIDNLGGILNAFTSKECTCFYVKLLDEHIDIGIDVLSDMILNSCFDKKDIEKEKSVILEELKMYEELPYSATVLRQFRRTPAIGSPNYMFR